jgi:predicted small lipoprotein YifL
MQFAPMRRAAATALVVAFVIAGCGVKGPLVPAPKPATGATSPAAGAPSVTDSAEPPRKP